MIEALQALKCLNNITFESVVVLANSNALWEVIAPHSGALLCSIQVHSHLAGVFFTPISSVALLLNHSSTVFQTLISLKLHHRITVKSLGYREKHPDLVLSWSLITTTRIMQKSIKLYTCNITTTNIPLPT